MKNQYYDGTKLLSMKDLNGNTPEIYIVTTNRTGGKTTYFNRLLFNKWLKNSEKFMLVYRFKYEVTDVADAFFKDIGDLFFQQYRMISKAKFKGAFTELYAGLKDNEDNELESCGYAVALSAADNIKRYSHLLSDTERMLMDEFQSETNHYDSNEVKNLMSIHTSVARGQGKQVRYVPLYMLSNCVSLINPYYTALGISTRLNKETKFLKGDGWVLEQGYVATASRAQQTSAFNRAFANGSDYLAYASQNVYLNDNLTFVETMTGKGKYLYTLKYKGRHFGVREFYKDGIIYCDDKPDMTFPIKISVGENDHDKNYVMLNNNMLNIMNLRYYFEHGALRFKDLSCKECIMNLISY